MLRLAVQHPYRWLDKPLADAALAEAYRANALFDARRDDPESTTTCRPVKRAVPAHRGRTRSRGESAGSLFGKKPGRGRKADPPVQGAVDEYEAGAALEAVVARDAEPGPGRQVAGAGLQLGIQGYRAGVQW
ncbi:hypothetical protein [Streptomyces sp. NPDC056401]|uniref:hypothetical protein n=1 Tax=Streptomyces sp. NPDC056401 TaxID=3345809 RepID=UPI0035D5F041